MPKGRISRESKDSFFCEVAEVIGVASVFKHEKKPEHYAPAFASSIC
jgi:hypothetical protein